MNKEFWNQKENELALTREKTNLILDATLFLGLAVLTAVFIMTIILA